MSCYKALISKKGDILSLSEEGAHADTPWMDIAAGSKYPDAVFVNAADYSEAKNKVKDALRKAEVKHLEHSDHVNP